MGNDYGTNDQHKELHDKCKQLLEDDTPEQIGIAIVYRTTDEAIFDTEPEAKRHQLTLDTAKELRKLSRVRIPWGDVCDVAPQVVTILQDFIEERTKI